MTDEEVRAFWQYVSEASMKYKEWRKGQTYMNALRTIAPLLYDMLYQTEADCFYQDSRIPKFREVLGI